VCEYVVVGTKERWLNLESREGYFAVLRGWVEGGGRDEGRCLSEIADSED
jgi:hypothetical protein